MKKLALILASVLTVTLATPAMADSGTITVDTSVENPVLQVTVPTALELALDPLALNGGTSQVTDTAFEIINNTENAAVFASFYLDVEVTQDVTFVSGSEIVDDVFDFESTDKKLGLGIIAADSYTPAVSDPATPSSATFDSDVTDSIKEFDKATKEADFAFALDKKGDTAPASAFAFYGILNAYADWEEGDVSVTGVYLIRALSPQTTVTNVSGTVGFVAPSVKLPTAPTESTVTPDGTAAHPYVARPGQTLAFSGPVAGTPADVYVKLSGAPDESSIYFVQTDPVNVNLPETYTWDKDTQILHITKSWGSQGVKPNLVTIGDKSYTFSITVSPAPEPEE